MVDDVAIIEMVEKPYIITREKKLIQTLNTIMWKPPSKPFKKFDILWLFM